MRRIQNHRLAVNGKVLLACFAGALLFGVAGTWIWQSIIAANTKTAVRNLKPDVYTASVENNDEGTKSLIPGPEVMADSAGVIPAITREEARRQAQLSLGRVSDPTVPVGLGTRSTSQPQTNDGRLLAARGRGHRKPPPPPELLAIWKNCGLFPPQQNNGQGNLPELLPVTKVCLAQHVVLTGVIEDRAILSLPTFSEPQRPRGRSVTVSAGDMVGPITVVAVKADSVELQEDGKKFIKYLQLQR